MTDENKFTSSAKINLNAQRMSTKGFEEQQIKKALFKDESLIPCLMEKICESKNLNLAYKRVKANKGAAGVDGMPIDAMSKFIKD